MELGTIGSPALWAGFIGLVLALLAIDLGIFHRRAHAVGFREALLWVVVWVGLAVCFNVWVWVEFGHQRGLEFLTGYLIEESLSVDNLFVFLMLFSYFGVPGPLQHRVLFWGILGALVMRAVFILAGAALLSAFHWVIYVFGAFLIITGIRMLTHHGVEFHPERNLALRLFCKLVPSVSEYEGNKFIVRRNGRRYATPLLAVLVTVEAADVMFAVDSIPAIFAVTRDPFIVFTSNIFAILGLRALYFVLARVVDRWRYLSVGLSIVLCFIGAKMLLSEVYKIPTPTSLAVVATVLGASMLISFLRPEPEKPKADLP
jgi:tellurite resistance protein TerC